ncbi:hypothetical protein [Providencia rettgeri]|uniref:hypothetical protein n=1 Tax=Providencia rettgeri TaxID=587 RepID=UPI001C8398C7|nr:hypothetical protein [Providencia rettgeri]MBX6999531.1 hypothetical protein [Providencia rettgeri]
MTKITKNIVYSPENTHCIKNNSSNKKSLPSSIHRIKIALESILESFRLSIINKRKQTLNNKSKIISLKQYFKNLSKYKKEIIHDKNSNSIILKTKIERFTPNSDDKTTSTALGHILESDGFTFDRELSDKFNKDFNRMNVYLHTPYRQENTVNIKDARVLTAKFGSENAQIISQITHQGFLADPLTRLHKINKDDNYIIGNNAIDTIQNDESIDDMRTSFTIKETENGDCIITANKKFKYINVTTSFGRELPNLLISVERKTYLTKRDDGTLELMNNNNVVLKHINDNKDKLKITIIKK